MSKDLTKYVEVGLRIRRQREKLGWTQEEFAERADISMSFVGHIERMEKMPSLDTMIRMSDVLGVGLDYLVFGTKTVKCDQQNCALYSDLNALMEAYRGRQET